MFIPFLGKYREIIFNRHFKKNHMGTREQAVMDYQNQCRLSCHVKFEASLTVHMDASHRLFPSGFNYFYRHCSEMVLTKYIGLRTELKGL